MKTLLASTLAIGGLLLAGVAQAGHPNDRAPRGYDYAQVVRVDPIVTTVQRPVQRDQCWREPVTYSEPVRYRSERRDRAPAVLGAIVGGVIGNQFGRGHGRDAATAAGALLGYHAVRDDQRRHDSYYGSREYVRYEEHCAVRTEYYQDEQVTGYDVTYRYRGQTFQTVTDYHPGNQIRVRVDVTPIP